MRETGEADRAGKESLRFYNGRAVALPSRKAAANDWSPVDVPPDSVGARSCFRSPGIIRSDYSDSRRARISESTAGGRVCERPGESVRLSVGHIDAVHGYGTVPLIRAQRSFVWQGCRGPSGHIFVELRAPKELKALLRRPASPPAPLRAAALSRKSPSSGKTASGRSVVRSILALTKLCDIELEHRRLLSSTASRRLLATKIGLSKALRAG